MKWQCKECDKIMVDADLLHAANPFSPDEDIVGCPGCKEVNQFRPICDFDGCVRQVGGGYPLADGRYVHRCWDHRPAVTEIA